MWEATASNTDLIVRVEAAERNMSVRRHRVMIMPVEQAFFKTRAWQKGFLRHIKNPKALSPSSRAPFARPRNREASPLSRRRADDAVPHRAVRLQLLL